jgi:hypothetical protein
MTEQVALAEVTQKKKKKEKLKKITLTKDGGVVKKILTNGEGCVRLFKIRIICKKRGNTS